MKEQVVLVDFESVQKLDLAQRPTDAFGFHIACHLGEARFPQRARAIY